MNLLTYLINETVISSTGRNFAIKIDFNRDCVSLSYNIRPLRCVLYSHPQNFAAIHWRRLWQISYSLDPLSTTLHAVLHTTEYRLHNLLSEN